MQTTQGNTLLSLRNVQSFLDDHAAELPGIAGTGARRRLDEVITALTTHRVDQAGSTFTAEGVVRRQHQQRADLLNDHMAPIARVARLDLPNSQELSPLRMPRGRISVERLAAWAFGMAQSATRFADVFIANGLPSTFIAELEAAATALTESLGQRTTSRGRTKGATTGLRSNLTTGRKIVHLLDVFVKRAAKGNDSLLSTWALVKRVPLTARRAATSTLTVSAAPTAPPTTIDTVIAA